MVAGTMWRAQEQKHDAQHMAQAPGRQLHARGFTTQDARQPKQPKRVCTHSCWSQGVHGSLQYDIPPSVASIIESMIPGIFPLHFLYASSTSLVSSCERCKVKTIAISAVSVRSHCSTVHRMYYCDCGMRKFKEAVPMGVMT